MNILLLIYLFILQKSNIFLNGKNLVIGDLGHAKELDENTSNSYKNFGTNNYLAPEATDKSKWSTKLDIWSYGCIVYELFNLEKLFNNRNHVILRDSIRNFKVNNINTKKFNSKINIEIFKK